MTSPDRVFRCRSCKWHNVEPGAFWVGMTCPRCGKDKIELVD